MKLYLLITELASRYAGEFGAPLSCTKWLAFSCAPQDLGPEMSSLLDALVDDDEAVTLGDSRVSGSRRRGGGGGPSSGVMRRRLDQLTPEQRQRLPQVSE
jgi:hypothetical protein